MTRLVDRVRRRRDAEDGAAFLWVAGMMVALIAFVSLAVDLGWYYLRSNQIQRAADAAALAGVVHVPGFPANADFDAQIAAELNGFDSFGTLGVDADTSYLGSVVGDNEFSVELESEIDLFFAPVIGVGNLPIKATSTAQYVKPVPLGSPQNCFGRDPTGTICTGPDPNTWAAISGPKTNKWNGDAYATDCYDTGSWSGASCSGTGQGPNSLYRPEGYYYAVEVPAGAGHVEVMVYDAGFYDRPSFGTETGDNFQDTGGGADTHFEMYMVDATPLDPSDNPAISGCRFDINSGSSASTYKNKWVELCDLGNDPAPGIYVLRVWTTGNDGGTNQYSLGATGSVTNPRIYGINDISIFNNIGGTATFKLAEIGEVHAGKRLFIELFDPGEASSGNLSILMPDGSVPPCTWYDLDEWDNQSGTSSGLCTITTSSGGPLYQGKWLNITVDIPDAGTYVCAPDCWWEIRYVITNPTDRTTWKAKVIGNPVRLVQNP